MAVYPSFPELSRAPDVSVKTTRDNPGIAAKMENGATITRPRYTRIRKTLRITYSLLTFDDMRLLDAFILQVGTWAIFRWTDNRDQANPVNRVVRFSKLPEDDDDKWADGQKRQKTQFEITEV